jgi:eukaryotic-like serine/threonine-protein kinase
VSAQEPLGTTPDVIRVGRYALHARLGVGGMASVYIGRLQGASGFAKTVAIKRLHPQYASDPEFAAMFVDEARLAARVVHPNVVSTLDVVHSGDDLLLVMEYIDGDSLAALMRGMAHHSRSMPLDVVSAIFCGVLSGLQAAHTATSDAGEPLSIVHRDMSPENVIVGVDGVARVLDFGIAKASNKSSVTKDGTVKGKLAYMAPEQVLGKDVTGQADLFAVATVMYELMSGQRLFKGDNDGATVRKLLYDPVRTLKDVVKNVSQALNDVVMRGLARDTSERYANALDMHQALEEAVQPATPRRVAEWCRSVVASEISKRASAVSSVERVALVASERPPAGAAAPSEMLARPSPLPQLATVLEPSIELPLYRPSRAKYVAVAGGMLAGLGLVLCITLYVQASEPSALRDPGTRVRAEVPRTLASSPLPAAVPVASSSSVATGASVSAKHGVGAHNAALPGVIKPVTKPASSYGRD